MSVQSPEFIAPPAAAAPAVTPPVVDPNTEDMTPEEAVAEIARARAAETQWKGLARKHEKENKAFKAAGATPAAAPVVAGAPAAAAVPVVDHVAVARAADLELENLKLRVGIDKGLDKALIARLVGTSEEELLEDADTLLKFQAPKVSLPGGSADGGAGGAGKAAPRPFDDWVRQQAGVKFAS